MRSENKIEIDPRGFFVAFGVLSVIYTLLLIIFWIIQGYRIVRDIDSWIDRAQVASDREDMTEYLNKLKTNMEKRGMTKGHAAVIFKTPVNDMSLHYKAIKRILERLNSIKEIPTNETAYQTALADLRGAIRELPNPGLSWIWARYIWWLLLIDIVLWIIVIILWIKLSSF